MQLAFPLMHLYVIYMLVRLYNQYVTLFCNLLFGILFSAYLYCTHFPFIFTFVHNSLPFLLFFAAIETIDITQILSLQDGEAVYPLPRIKSLAVHPKLNLTAVLFAVKHFRP